MSDDLLWLERLLEARGRVAGDVRRRQVGLGALVSPYVADAPDRPIVAAAEDFPQGPSWRSEEHTSELQSLMRISYAVFCLKKKKQQKCTQKQYAQQQNVRERKTQ